MRWAVTSVCTALRAQTRGGHVTRSITMDASFCCCWLQGFPPGYHRPGEPPGLIYLPTWPGHWKIKLKVSKITALGLVFWLLSCWMRAPVKKGILKFIQILRPIDVLSYPAINLPPRMHCMQFHWHRTTSLSDTVCCCSIYRRACRSPSGITIVSVSVFLSSEK